jgi:hypothetical protein
MRSLLINRILNVCFLILGLYQLVISKDYFQAAASFGIGLAFDPVSHDISWPQRTMLQKSIPIIQLAICAACLGLGFGMNDR